MTFSDRKCINKVLQLSVQERKTFGNLTLYQSAIGAMRKNQEKDHLNQWF